MSVISQLQKRAVSLALSSALIFSGTFAVSTNALEPYEKFFAKNLYPDRYPMSHIENFCKHSSYLGKKINFKLNNSLYLIDIYTASYQAIKCLKIYNKIDKRMFTIIKEKILRDTIDLIKIFDILTQDCPYESNQNEEYFEQINEMKQFLGSIGVGEKEWNDPNNLTSKHEFLHFTWHRDLKSKIFMTFLTENPDDAELFHDLCEIIKKINSTSIALKNCSERKFSTPFEKKFAPFVLEDILEGPKLKDFIYWTKRNIYESESTSSPTELKSKYDRIGNDLTNISTDDYINILLISILYHDYLENPIYEEEETSSKRKNSLDKISLLLLYYNAVITSAETKDLPVLGSKISEIEDKFLKRHRYDISDDALQSFKNISDYMKMIIKNNAQLYAQSLKNGTIPLKIEEIDSENSDTEKNVDILLKNKLDKEFIYLIPRIMHEFLEKCEPLFTSQEFIDYAFKPINYLSNKIFPQSIITESELDTYLFNYPGINPFLGFYAKNNPRIYNTLEQLKELDFKKPPTSVFPLFLKK
ncbi:MAG: hypothetical protein ACI4PR_05000 [Acutalibacteraceae bacterium]